MKIGVKIWPGSGGHAFSIARHADFIEIMAVRGSDMSFLKDIELPFVVHAEHSGMGINCADSARQKEAADSLRFAIELADNLDARTIIIHPGCLDGSPGASTENAVKFIGSIRDDRIAVENLVFKESAGAGVLMHPFSSPESMKGLLSATHKGLCLDFSHASVAASFMKRDTMDVLEEFMQLNPRHFHVCGGVAGALEDMHLHLWEGNLDIGAFKRVLPKTAWVTLETPNDLEGRIRDIGIMRS